MLFKIVIVDRLYSSEIRVLDYQLWSYYFFSGIKRTTNMAFSHCLTKEFSFLLGPSP